MERQYKEEIDKKNKEIIFKQKKELETLNYQRKRLERIFNRKVEDIKNIKIKEFLEDFEKTANDFLIEDISIYKDEKIINNFIEKLFQSENIIPTIFYHLNLFLENYKDKMKNIEHINIILVGPAGTGKSTLINSILNVNAPEGF